MSDFDDRIATEGRGDEAAQGWRMPRASRRQGGQATTAECGTERSRAEARHDAHDGGGNPGSAPNAALASAVTTLARAADRLDAKAMGEWARYLEARGEDTGVRRGLDSIYFHGRANAFREAAEDLREAAEALAPGLAARLRDEDAVAALLNEFPDVPALSLIEGGR